MVKIEQQEVRWHVAQLFSRLKLTKSERRSVFNIRQNFIKDQTGGGIVKTFAMQALADLAEQDKGLRSGIISQIEDFMRSGSPAMKSRGKKLLVRRKRQ
jgi:hypothetical protein